MREIKIGECCIGDNHPTFIVAEIGINHNGDIDLAKRLIDAALLAGCNAVKFQKRTPELCVPVEQRDMLRETPWGVITYLEYRYKVEFGEQEYTEIDKYCAERNILWFASPWDEQSVEFLEEFDPPCYKVASASLTDKRLLERLLATNRPLIVSTGMSTHDEIRAAVEVIGSHDLLLMHTTSTYPCPPNELNLQMIQTLHNDFSCPIGYSGHEVGLQTTLAAVVLGACAVERHLTLDRAMWGSDQAASVEPHGMARLVRDIRTIEEALGDGVKQVYESEIPSLKRLRRTHSETQ